MQYVLLAGGISSRFWPYSEKRHKSLIKVGGRSLVSLLIDRLKGQDIILVSRRGDIIPKDIEKDVKIVYQEEPKGMYDAILSAESYLNDEFIVVSAYQIDIVQILDKLSKVDSPAVVLRRYEVGDEKTHGIAGINGDKVVNIQEKRKFDGGDFSVVSIYKLNKEFIERMKHHKSNDEYILEDVLNEFASEGKLNFVLSDGKMFSLKYPFDLIKNLDKIYDALKCEKSNNVNIGKNSFIEDSVIIGNNVKIGNNVSLKGKTYIGDDTFIGDNVLIRDSIIGRKVMVGFCTEIARSIIMDETHIHSGFIGDSVVGESCRFGANLITANKRIDRGSIHISIDDKDIDTGLVSFGMIVGDNVKTGINCSVMPGSIIGNDCIIGADTEIKGTIKSGHLIYSKSEIIQKDV